MKNLNRNLELNHRRLAELTNLASEYRLEYNLFETLTHHQKIEVLEIKPTRPF